MTFPHDLFAAIDCSFELRPLGLTDEHGRDANVSTCAIVGHRHQLIIGIDNNHRICCDIFCVANFLNEGAIPAIKHDHDGSPPMVLGNERAI